jgi:hypothetical protein
LGDTRDLTIWSKLLYKGGFRVKPGYIVCGSISLDPWIIVDEGKMMWRRARKEARR